METLVKPDKTMRGESFEVKSSATRRKEMAQGQKSRTHRHTKRDRELEGPYRLRRVLSVRRQGAKRQHTRDQYNFHCFTRSSTEANEDSAEDSVRAVGSALFRLEHSGPPTETSLFISFFIAHLLTSVFAGIPRFPGPACTAPRRFSFLYFWHQQAEKRSWPKTA